MNKGMGETGGGLKTILIAVIALCVGGILVYGYEHYFATPKEEPHTAAESVTAATTESSNVIVIESEEKLPYEVKVKFDDILLGEAQREKKLIVMTQEASVSHTVEKKGLWELPFFSQTKAMIFYGTGEYTVDFSGITKDSFDVDDQKKIITIHIPEPELSVYYIPEKTEFFNSSNGLLRFGEMELTPEMMTEIETIAKSKLQNKMEADNSMMETAEKFAKLSVKELYEPIMAQSQILCDG